MVFGRALAGNYPTATSFEMGWRTLVNRLGGDETIVGHSVQGRPLYRFDIGPKDAPPVFLTALIHGIEVIGSVALFHILRDMAQSLPGQRTLGNMRLVMMPIVNPDAFATNMDRLDRGWPALRRTNARGVDLNRNFPHVAPIERFHLFSGSRWRGSPHYQGPAPFSEPETQAIRRVVEQVRPQLSIGFHSFGNMLLYPWAFSPRPNKRHAHYRQLADGFLANLKDTKYSFRQASQFYPTVGDLDDWLDHEHGTLAMTIEVGSLNRRLWHPLRLLNPFCWMNPLRIESTVASLVPGFTELLAGFTPLHARPALLTAS
ncbi:MAG: M14 family metallopeptidase [Deltaproteobacteria bacterium]|nr:M14 family metallopeptidase [Deltaproteobacteria bacterium]